MINNHYSESKIDFELLALEGTLGLPVLPKVITLGLPKSVASSMINIGNGLALTSVV